MGNPKLILLVLYLAAGLVMVGLSIPLIMGRIAPNGWYGFRVKQTMENPKFWYLANRYAGYHVLGLGVGLLIVAIITFSCRRLALSDTR